MESGSIQPNSYGPRYREYFLLQIFQMLFRLVKTFHYETVH